MAGGLAITGFLAYYVAHSSFATVLKTSPGLLFILIIAELALVFSLVARVQKMKASTATILFVVYAALNGVTLSGIFYVYKTTAISSTFFICAATFLACSVYGMTTKRDLTGVGGFMMMGLIGIIIASVINIIFNIQGLSLIISYIGVFVFIGLTAYDTQKLKHMAISQPAGVSDAVVRKGAIMGALTLYLDFINLFLFLLRIFGGGRD
jgi:FtsH-binding integral membrane protein